MVERGRHPRFAIGESSTPLANLLLEELADRYDLPHIRVFSKWGTWQRSRPDVAGGLKRGFTFYFHRPGEPFADDRDHARQLLVAASPHDEIGDTHWYRPDFDATSRARRKPAGAIYLDETELTGIEHHGDRTTLEGTRHGDRVRINASFVVDASGPRGFLARALGLEAPPLTWLPPTQGLYTHFTNVERWDEVVARRRRRRDAALPAGYGGPPSRVSRRLDLDAALQQRHHERRRGADRSGAPRTLARQKARRPGNACSRCCRPCASSSATRAPSHPWIHAPRIAFRTRQVCGPTLGAPAVGRGRDRSAALDRLSADAARHRTTARRPGAHDARPRTRSRAAALRAGHARRARRHRAAGRRALRDHERRRRSSSASRCSISPQRATAKRRADSTNLSWRLVSCSTRTITSDRSCGRASHSPQPHRAIPRAPLCSIASIARSNRSTPPGCSIARGATGIPCWRPT